ncbi:MAG: M20 family metallopeptidase [Tissierellia bacterium]|nr:M20 family metallopeptidase [Tissierellia bacterium]
MLEREYQKEVIKLLQEAVKIPSINPPGEEKAMGEFVYDYMTKNGIETEKIMVQKDRFNVLSKIPGKSRKGILFTGHMDVVPVSEEEKKRWNLDPFGGVIIGNHLYGRGASDMKSGLCAIMVAMKILKEQNIVPEQDIAFVATVDEEDAMLGSKAMIGREDLKNYKSCVVAEPTNMILCNRGRGRTYGNLYIKGQTGHGSRACPNHNAILLCNKIIDKMNKTTFDKIRTPEKEQSFWQPLAIEAGVEPCVVPDSCTMKIDARLVLNHDPEDIWIRMKEIIDEIQVEIPEIQVDIEIIDKRESWTTSCQSPIMKQLKKVYEDLHFIYETKIFTGTTDGTVFRRDGRDIVIIGPGDLSCVHRENEKVNLEEVQRSVELYLRLMKSDISGEK